MLKYVTSQTQCSLKLPSEEDIKALPALNANSGSQFTNSIVDSDTSPFVNGDVLREGVTPTKVTSVMEGTTSARESEEKFLSKLRSSCSYVQCFSAHVPFLSS